MVFSVTNTFTNGTDAEAPQVNENFIEVEKFMQQIYDNFEQETLSVTTSSDSVSYAATRTNHLIKNIGANKCFINTDGAATTDSFPIEPGDSLNFEGDVDAIHAITASSTTTLRIIGQS